MATGFIAVLKTQVRHLELGDIIRLDQERHGPSEIQHFLDHWRVVTEIRPDSFDPNFYHLETEDGFLGGAPITLPGWWATEIQVRPDASPANGVTALKWGLPRDETGRLLRLHKPDPPTDGR